MPTSGSQQRTCTTNNAPRSPATKTTPTETPADRLLTTTWAPSRYARGSQGVYGLVYCRDDHNHLGIKFFFGEDACSQRDAEARIYEYLKVNLKEIPWVPQFIGTIDGIHDTVIDTPDSTNDSPIHLDSSSPGIILEHITMGFHDILRSLRRWGPDKRTRKHWRSARHINGITLCVTVNKLPIELLNATLPPASVSTCSSSSISSSCSSSSSSSSSSSNSSSKISNRGERADVILSRSMGETRALLKWLVTQFDTALACIHSTGVVHNDIKPGNLRFRYHKEHVGCRDPDVANVYRRVFVEGEMPWRTVEYKNLQLVMVDWGMAEVSNFQGGTHFYRASDWFATVGQKIPRDGIPPVAHKCQYDRFSACMTILKLLMRSAGSDCVVLDKTTLGKAREVITSAYTSKTGAQDRVNGCKLHSAVNSISLGAIEPTTTCGDTCIPIEMLWKRWFEYWVHHDNGHCLLLKLHDKVCLPFQQTWGDVLEHTQTHVSGDNGVNIVQLIDKKLMMWNGCETTATVQKTVPTTHSFAKSYPSAKRRKMGTVTVTDGVRTRSMQQCTRGQSISKQNTTKFHH